jgi:hypothetical protein
VVDVFDRDARYQAVDRQAWSIVRRAQVREPGVVERIDLGPEAVLGRPQPTGQPVAGPRHLEAGKVEALILEGPVAIDVGPRREVVTGRLTGTASSAMRSP